MKRTESDITNAIRGFLSSCGFFNYKHWQGPMSYPKGVSDIIGIEPKTGRYMAIEVKRPGQKLTSHQKQFQDDVRYAGGIAFVATCVQDVIDELGLEKRLLA